MSCWEQVASRTALQVTTSCLAFFYFVSSKSSIACNGADNRDRLSAHLVSLGTAYLLFVSKYTDRCQLIYIQVTILKRDRIEPSVELSVALAYIVQEGTLICSIL
jgi:hypothetical protein